MSRKANPGDLVRIIRPKGHRLRKSTPIGRVFRVRRIRYDGEHCWYAALRRIDWWRADEIELLSRRRSVGPPTKRQRRNERYLGKYGLDSSTQGQAPTEGLGEGNAVS